MPICDLNVDVKPWLGIDVAETKHDAVLTTILKSVEKSVLNYTEAAFTQQVVVGELLDGNDSDTITPRNSPIASVQQVVFNVQTDGTGGNALDQASYYLPKDMDEIGPDYEGDDPRGSSGILLRHMGTPRGRGYVRVDYTYGYDGVPPDVKHAILLAIEADFRRKGRKSIGTAGRSKKDESERFTNSMTGWDKKTGLPQEVVYKLNPYRVFEFPTQPMATFNK
jgi:hypothetical protein